MKTPLIVAMGAALCFASCGSTEVKAKDNNGTNATANANTALKMAKFELEKVP